MRESGNANACPHRRLYRLAIWQRLRRAQLAREPLCKYCNEAGTVAAACVVDHVQPHRGHFKLFADPSNLQSLCKACHDSRKQREEAHGYHHNIDADTGWPVDPKHPANLDGGLSHHDAQVTTGPALGSFTELIHEKSAADRLARRLSWD